MSKPSHYHVDVFSGQKGEYVSGLLLEALNEGDGWRLRDEHGLLGDRGAVVSGPQPLEDALRTALQMMYGMLEKPLLPVWGAAPFERIGYVPPTTRRVFGVLKVWAKDGYDRAANYVGQDGRPEAKENG
jgi:hypothetical protein